MQLARAVVVSILLVAACTDSGQTEDSLDTIEQLATSGPPGTSQIAVVERGSGWRYWDQGPACATWKDGSCLFYDGTGPLGYGESYLATTVSYGGNPNNRHRTTYFGTHFRAPSTVRALFLRVMYDDGFVFYLNGHEGGRANMPSGPISFSTLTPAGHEAGNAYVTYDISSQIPHLGSPNNIDFIAFEVHQGSASSSDLVFDAELIAWVDPLPDDDLTTGEGIPRGSRWNFWDRTTSPGAWKPAAYDDSGWSDGPGPLGFGESYVATTINAGPITNYFRKPFRIDGTFRGLSADVVYDDGFVAYLNGTEIARAAMPSGTITSTTQASGHEAGNTYQHFDWDHATSLLVPGDNVLAVEVHQAGTASSDLVFDLGLTVEGAWTHGFASGRDLYDVWFIDGDHGFAVGNDGTLIRITNGGTTWTQDTPFSSLTFADLMGVQFVNAQRGWIVGSMGAIFRTDDGGVSWTQQTTGTSDHYSALAFVDANTGWILANGAPGPRNRLFHTVDGGATWTLQTVPDANGLSDIAFFDANRGWAVGGDTTDDLRTIWATTDGGATWTVQWQNPDQFSREAIAVTVVDANTVWVVGISTPHDDGGEEKLVTRDGGLTWTEAPRSAANMGLTDITFADATHGWATGEGGVIIATTDGGLTWDVQQVPDLVEDADRIIGDGPTYFAIHFGDTQHGWTTGQSGNYRSTTTGGY